MILVAALLLAGTSIDEAEHALAAGRYAQAEQMVRQIVAKGEKGDRVDRLRAASAASLGRHGEALALYGQQARKYPSDAKLADGAARAAYRLGRIDEAWRWSAAAIALPGADWSMWNLAGVIADMRGEFDRSDEYYGRAMALAPGRAEILNNQGWSLLLRGQWMGAAERFRKALDADPASKIARSNLDLAEAALATDLPARRSGETSESYAARLNDTGVIAQAAGDRTRAIAAFSQAVALHSRWSETAAANLAQAQRQ